uniref:Uncharacterized protein n=1 Tax=Caenorhabditis japonica TaxID=281687 RepID=A0A8R1E4E3_CAEJA
MPAIKFMMTGHHDEDGIKVNVQTSSIPNVNPVIPMISSQYRVEIVWIQHSRLTHVAYFLFAAISTTYYLAAFIAQYGAFPWIHDSHSVPMQCLNEASLTRVIMIQWLMLSRIPSNIYATLHVHFGDGDKWNTDVVFHQGETFSKRKYCVG